MDQPCGDNAVTSQLVSGMSRDEMAVIYCAAILADDDVTITADKLTTLLRAANLSNVEPIWPTLYARALGSGCDVRRLLTSVGAVGTSGPAAQQQQQQQQPDKAAAAADVKQDAQPAAAVDDDDDDDDLNLDLFG